MVDIDFIKLTWVAIGVVVSICIIGYIFFFLTRAAKENKIKEQQLNNLHRKVASLNLKLEKLDFEKVKLEDYLKEEKEKNKELLSEIERLNTLLKDAPSKLEYLTKENHTLKQQVKEKEEEINNLNNMLVSLKRNIEVLRKELEEAKSGERYYRLKDDE